MSQTRVYKVEYCRDCPHCSLVFCQEEDEPIPQDMYDEGVIPDWCPLPKETDDY